MVLCVQNVPHSLMPLNNYSKLVKLFGEILETLTGGDSVDEVCLCSGL